ncbi:NAD(P)/FAD-dependent oxidoreductase [Arenicellales bacterium nBUS_48]
MTTDPSLSKNEFDAVIAGAGIIGTSIAFALSQRSYRVLVVDPLAGAGQGATSGSLAMIRTQYSTLEGTALAWEGFHCWNDWKNFIGLTDNEPIAPFHRAGVLTFKTPNNDYLRHPLEFSKQLGIPFSTWSLAKLQEVFPSWDFSTFGPPVISDHPNFGQSSKSTPEGIYFPCGGYCADPQLAAKNLQRAAEKNGVVFHFNRGVSGIDLKNNQIRGVTLTDGTDLPCKILVNAAGPHAQALITKAGLSGQQQIGTRVLRHQTVHINCADSKSADGEKIMLYDTDIGSYMREDTGDAVLVGSLGAEGEYEDAVDPEGFDRNIAPSAIEPLYRLAQRIPAMGIPNSISGLADLWDVSDDWIPIYDCTDVRGFYLSIGTSGNQFKTAPAAGQMMANLIDACETGVRHDKQPVRYRLPRTGHEISLGFFSRNREPNAASSLSVLG